MGLDWCQVLHKVEMFCKPSQMVLWFLKIGGGSDVRKHLPCNSSIDVFLRLI